LIDPRQTLVVCWYALVRTFRTLKQVRTASERRRRNYRSSWEAIMLWRMKWECY